VASFKGYGNPDGKYWFIGLEEGFSPEDESSRDRELRREIRIREGWSDLEDIHQARESLGVTRKGRSPMYAGSPAWRGMSIIALKANGDHDWDSRSHYTRYKEQLLARLDGETFLTELYPLPSKNHKLESWPYVGSYVDRVKYEKEILPTRRDLINRVMVGRTPEIVFCYGLGARKGNKESGWDDFQTLFEGEYDRKTLHKDDRYKKHSFKITRIDQTIVVLMMHLASWPLASSEALGELVDEVSRYQR